LVNFGPLFQGAQIFDRRYLRHFLTDCDKIWVGYGFCEVVSPKKISVNFGPHFREHKFSIASISDTTCRIISKFCMVMSLTNGHLFPEFGEL